MLRDARSWAVALPAVALMSFSLPARAWIELSVASDGVTIDVARDGTAVVAHELLLRIRGTSLKELALTEVDPDAEPFPDATLTLASSGRAAGLPIPLSVENAGGKLVARFIDIKALRYSGSYLGRIRYRTDFKELGRIRPVGPYAELKWQSPVFDNGIDAMRVVFRLPRAPSPPELPKADAARVGVGIAEEFGGVFLGTLRRGSEVDELEIVRPHVAKGERVYWHARVDPKAFDFPIVNAPVPMEKAVSASIASPAPRAPIYPWLIAGAFAIIYAALVALKGRLVRRACQARDVVPSYLVPIPAVPRIILAGAALFAAAILPLETEYTTPAGVLMMIALACAVHTSPRGRPALRGPGRWAKATLAEAFAKGGSPTKLSGRFLDAGSPHGFFIFLAMLSGFVAAAVVVGQRSGFWGVMIALGSACLFPIFCTGRAGELPADPLHTARRLLRPLYKSMRREHEITVSPSLRFPDGRSDPDELRLIVEPKRPKRGLIAIELGYDAYRGPTAAIPVPYVIVRAMDVSEALEALPKGLLWTRGRTPDERVTVLRPRLPTSGATLSLVRRVLAALVADGERRQVATSAKSSSGRRSSTSKGKTTSSPAHAT